MTYQTILNSPDITQDIPDLLEDYKLCAESTGNLHENKSLLHRTGLRLQEILQELEIENSTIIKQFDALKDQYKNVTPEVENQSEEQIETLRDAHRMCVARLLVKQEKGTEGTTMHQIGGDGLNILY